MGIEKLWIQNLRILSTVEIEPDPGLNIIYGDNASGKTSMLEAIYYLSRGRSFKSAQVGELISHQQNFLLVGAQDGSNTFAIKRSKKSLLMKANRQVLNKVADLAQFSAVQIIHPDSHLLVSGSSKLRRQFLDWGLFHVEPQFYPVWLRYQRALKQRNVLLKKWNNKRLAVPIGNNGYPPELMPWDNELSSCASQIDDYRQQHFLAFYQELKTHHLNISGARDIEIQYQSGWDSKENLAQALQQVYVRDQQRGFTTVGAHRADLQIKVNGHHAQNEISRGQQKMLVAALILAQCSLYQQKTQKAPCILIDDLGAELDKKHQHALLEKLQTLKAQIFITCIDIAELDLSHWQQRKMFHVEHGKLQQVL